MVRIIDFLRKFNKTNSLSVRKNKDWRQSKSILPAFSLAEVLIAMLVMSLFFLATTKVISVKQKDDPNETPHGYYECLGDGNYSIHRVDGGAETIPEGSTSTICEFKPVKNIPFYNIYAIRINPIGFYKQVEPQITDENEITFSGAKGLIELYKDAFDNADGASSLEDTMAKYVLYGEYTQFKNYVTTTYTQSLLGRAWTGANPPFDAVFIVW